MKDREVAIPKHLADLGPVARVWAVCNAMPTAPRKAVLAACKKIGINANTAATQYNLWQYSRRQKSLSRGLPRSVRREVERAVEVFA